MRSFITLSIVLLLAAGSSGCLVTGQITIIQSANIGATTNTAINKYSVDLTDNQDWQDNKDDIVSVDAVAIVACIINNLAANNNGEVWWSDDPDLTTVAAIQDGGTRLMVSPNLPGDDKTLIDWQDAFQYMENEDSIISQILGDGVFTLYGIAKNTPFDMDIDAEVVITVTVKK